MTEVELNELRELLKAKPSAAVIAKARVVLKGAGGTLKEKPEATSQGHPKLTRGEATARRSVGRAKGRMTALQRQIAAAQALITEERIHTPVYCGPYSREPFTATFEHLHAQGSIHRLRCDLEWLQQNYPRVWAELYAEQTAGITWGPGAMARVLVEL